MVKSKKIEWEIAARRLKNHPALLVYLMADNFASGRTSTYLETTYQPQYYRQFDNARWLDKESIRGYLAVLKRKEKAQPGYLLRIARIFYNLEKMFIRYCQKVSKQKFDQLSNQQLSKVMKKWLLKNKEIVCLDYTYMHVNDFYPNLLEETLIKKVKDYQQRNHYLKILLTPDQPTEIREEKEKILRLAQQVKKTGFNKKVNQAIKNHVKKFDYLGMYIFLGKPYTETDIKKRLRYLMKGEIRTELQEIAEQKKSGQLSRQIMSKLKFTRRQKLIVKTIKAWVFAINHVEEAWNKGILLSQPLISEVLSRLKIKWDDLVQLSEPEIIKAIEKGKVETKIRKKITLRKQDNIVLMCKKKIELFEGKELKKYYAQEKKGQPDLSHIKQLKGQPAAIGSAQGRVRLIITPDSIKEMQKGEILVASATTPMHVPAMEKASAIITDEGGLLSHAAIVSRELGVPCVVGTKIATKVFKDGDRVEVDATKGIIRKLLTN